MISCSFACLLASLLKLFMDLYFEAGSASDFSQRSSSVLTAMSNHLFSNRIIPAINLKRDRLCFRYIGQLVTTGNARTIVSATNYIANNWPSRVFMRCSVFSWKKLFFPQLFFLIYTYPLTLKPWYSSVSLPNLTVNAATWNNETINFEVYFLKKYRLYIGN